MNDSEILKKCDLIRETAFEAHKYLRHGFLEKIYENSLTNRLRKKGFIVDQQKPLEARDEDGTLLGEYFADLFVENVILVELKASKGLAEEHTAQILGCLRACNIRHGMLINFGASKIEFKKLVL